MWNAEAVAAEPSSEASKRGRGGSAERSTAAQCRERILKKLQALVLERKQNQLKK